MSATLGLNSVATDSNLPGKTSSSHLQPSVLQINRATATSATARAGNVSSSAALLSTAAGGTKLPTPSPHSSAGAVGNRMGSRPVLPALLPGSASAALFPGPHLVHLPSASGGARGGGSNNISSSSDASALSVVCAIPCPSCGEDPSSASTSAVSSSSRSSFQRPRPLSTPTTGALSQCQKCFWRRLPLPDRYPSPEAYCVTQARALLQEVNYAIGELAAKYWAAHFGWASGLSSSASSNSGSGGGFSAGGSQRGGQSFPLNADPYERQRVIRQGGVPFYACVDLIRLPASASKSGVAAKTAREQKEAKEAAKAAKKKEREEEKAKKKAAAAAAKKRNRGWKKGARHLSDDSEDDDDDEDEGDGGGGGENSTARKGLSSTTAAGLLLAKWDQQAALISDVSDGNGGSGSSSGSSFKGPHTIADVLSDDEHRDEQLMMVNSASSAGMTPPAPPPQPRFMLKLRSSDKERTAAYAKDDLWIISTTALFGADSVSCTTSSSSDSAIPLVPPTPFDAFRASGTGAFRGGGGGNPRNNDFFAPVPAQQPFTFLARSVFHGPSSRDMLEIEPIAPLFGLRQGGSLGSASAASAGALDPFFASTVSSFPSTCIPSGARAVRACAIRGPNIGTEASALEALSALRLRPDLLPVLPSLLGGSSSSSSIVCRSVPQPLRSSHPSSLSSAASDPALCLRISRSRRDELTSAVITEFKLNDDQAETVRAAARWLPCLHDADDDHADDDATFSRSSGARLLPPDPSSGTPPVLLCHGVFGSGKSHTLVAVLALLSQLLDESEGRQPMKIEPPDASTLASATAPDAMPALPATSSNTTYRNDEDKDDDSVFDEDRYAAEADIDMGHDDDSDGDVIGAGGSAARGSKVTDKGAPKKQAEEEEVVVSDSDVTGREDAAEDNSYDDDVVLTTGRRGAAAKPSPAAFKAGPRQVSPAAVMAADKTKAPPATAFSAASSAPAAAVAEPRVRMLVAAATNTAVDRVLLGLQKSGRTDFTRVGALRKIAKQLLPHVLPHASRGDAIEATIQELQTMLQPQPQPQFSSYGRGYNDSDVSGGASSPEERAAVAAALAQARDDKAFVQRLQNARVYGTTCAASVFPVLAPLTFHIVILDEASQMVEPVSLLPLARFGAQRVLAVGDPLQLPPVTADPPVSKGTLQAIAATQQQQANSISAGLDKCTMFERLARAGAPLVMLRTQYRCHPVLSGLASRLFYSGRLQDGIKPYQRGPLFRLLPPLMLFDYSNAPALSDAFSLASLISASPSSDASQASSQSQRQALFPRLGPLIRFDPATTGERADGSGSLSNGYEADVIARIVSLMLARGTQPSNVGVICLYRAQVGRVRASLANVPAAASVQVSSVDAFQGNEKNVIIISTCRTQAPAGTSSSGSSSSASGTGFLDDPRRLNVALTRARNHLMVVGHAATLLRLPLWRDLIMAAGGANGGIRSTGLQDLLQAPPPPPAAAQAIASTGPGVGHGPGK